LGAAILGVVVFIGLVDSVGGLAGMALLFGGIFLLGIAALRWGVDSCDGRNWKPIFGWQPRKNTSEHDRLRAEHLSSGVVDGVIEVMERDFDARRERRVRR
jgi:hypothetical protein